MSKKQMKMFFTIIFTKFSKSRGNSETSGLQRTEINETDTIMISVIRSQPLWNRLSSEKKGLRPLV